ncbi:MAG: hypothetical protein HY290_18475 [Planctomycetia bacterium]|nr:hypothetical protein [Planctomycetia bacterium]
MHSTFGGFWVHRDQIGTHVVLSLPKNVDAGNVKRMQYAGPRIIMPERVSDFKQWLEDRKREGFVLNDAD